MPFCLNAFIRHRSPCMLLVFLDPRLKTAYVSSRRKLGECDRLLHQCLQRDENRPPSKAVPLPRRERARAPRYSNTVLGPWVGTSNFMTRKRGDQVVVGFGLSQVCRPPISSPSSPDNSPAEHHIDRAANCLSGRSAPKRSYIAAVGGVMPAQVRIHSVPGQSRLPASLLFCESVMRNPRALSRCAE